MAKNKHGLSRNIPNAVKLLVRQNSGFGCVFCGLWITQYEHFNPDFKDATVHNADGICLLCGSDHQRVTSKIISKQQVATQYKSPFALQRGYANEYLKLNGKFFVSIGRVLFTETGNLIQIEGESMLSITQPTSTEPLKLNAKFCDDESNTILEIFANEMRGQTTNWDINQVGSRTIFRKKGGEIVLQINILPPDVIEVEKINMSYKGSRFESDSDTGRILIKTKRGGGLDLPKGQIITRGLKIKENECSLDGAMIMGVQEGFELSKMDYRSFIDSGMVHSIAKEE